jgi:mRNA-degrading endonuclease RelE of RelBE toxin-antitoxin system
VVDRPRYRIEISSRAATELDQLRPFDQRPVVQALRQLVYEAEVETRNRKPLRAEIRQFPEATWELRVGRHRVFYEVQAGATVRVLRVIIKTGTTAESL